MASTRTTFRVLAACLLAALLAACGGGGGNPGTTNGTSGGGGSGSGGNGGNGGVTPGASTVEKYLGTWVQCTQISATDSVLDRLVFAKSSETSMSASVTSTFFATVTCSGPAGQTLTTNSTVTLAGTKTINGETADRINVTNSSGATKDVLMVRNDGKLYTGSTTGGVDGDGYPTTIEPAGFTKG